MASAGDGVILFQPFLDALGVADATPFSQESSSTMMTFLSAMLACITRQRPASLM
jgi:hypothetical protein